MPVWVNIVLQMLPTIVQEIIAIVQAIQANGGNPTPAQAEQLASLWAVHKSMSDAADIQMASMVKAAKAA